MLKSIFWTAFGCALLALPIAARADAKDKKDQPRLHARGDAASSQWLEKQVGHQLRMLPYYSVFDNLEYRLRGYRVELLGQVVRPTLKADAEAAVKSIEGVEGVTNHIEVLPVSFNDDRVRLACYRSVFSSAPLQKYARAPVPSIHIVVKNGNVTLVGVVDSEGDRNIAKIQANQVSGAFSVTNNLRVVRGG